MDKIEVSGEMLDAGEDAVLGEVGGADLGGHFDPREFAATVYRAMERVHRKQTADFWAQPPIRIGSVGGWIGADGNVRRDPRDTISFKIESD